MAQKRIVSQHFTLAEAKDEAEYYVEEFRKNKWRTVSGPYDTKDKADNAARKYSGDNPGVRVRVVVYQ